MGRTSTEKIWLIGTALVGFVLVLVGYFFFISSQRDETDQVNGQISNAQLQNTGLQSRISALEAQNKKLASYQLAYRTAELALPSTADTTNFLRTIQSLGNATSTTITTLTVGDPAPVAGATAAAPAASTSSAAAGSANGSGGAGAASGIYEIPITASVTGLPDQLNAFLVQLQSVQPRAVLITDIARGGTTPDATTTSTLGGGRTTLQLTLKAFVAPAAAPAAAATPTAAAP